MTPDLDKAKKELYVSGDTVIVVKDEVVLARRREKRIKPLLDITIELGEMIKGAALADRVIGKGAALLAVKSGIAAVHGVMISEPALVVLQQYHIPVSYERLVAAIENQTRTGLCPVEKLVSNIDHPLEAYDAIRAFVYE